MNERLNLLLRKNIGKQKAVLYKNVFKNSGFNDDELELVLLENSEIIIDKLKGAYSDIKRVVEIIKADLLFIDSDLMRKIYLKLSENSKCYIYTDDYLYCGIYKVSSKKAFELAFNVAKIDIQNTCFLLDTDFNYSILINYIEETNMLDVQLW